MNELHLEVSDILTKKLYKTNMCFPLGLTEVSHVWLLPISLWSLGMKGEGMMSWSGGGGGEKGWWRIWMFVRSLHHFLLSEALASFLIQWEQCLPDLSGKGRKTAPHVACEIGFGGTLGLPLSLCFPSELLRPCAHAKQQLRNGENDYSCRKQISEIKLISGNSVNLVCQKQFTYIKL